MIKAIALASLIALSGCAGVPAAVIWTTTGAGLGLGAAAFKFDDDLFNYWAAQRANAAAANPTK